MAFEFKFPDVEEGIEEGVLIKWHVKEGDEVKTDAVLAEVETDKAVVELPSPRTGTILKLHAKEGETIHVGNTVVTIGEKGEAVTPSLHASAPSVAQTEPAKEEAKTETPASQQTQTSSEHKIQATLGTRKLAQQLGVNLNTVKGTGSGGRITDEDVKALGGTVPARAQHTAQQNMPHHAAPMKKVERVGPVKATPTVRKLALQHNLDIESIPGTGASEIVTETDVLMAAGQLPSIGVAVSTGTSSGLTFLGKPVEKPHVTIEGEVEEIPLKGVRKIIAEKMVESFFASPVAVHMEEIDVTELAKIRTKEKEAFAKRGVKLTYLGFIVKAVTHALKLHPNVNASLDEEKQAIILKKYYNIGIATDTEHGLMVPVVKDADKKTIEEISKDIQALAQQARDRKISIADMKGQTFTITNVGSLGGVYAIPIINQPDAAILGLGKLIDRPMVVDGKIEIRKVLTVSLAFDHRIIDGADAARFMNDVVRHLNDPNLLMIENE